MECNRANYRLAGVILGERIRERMQEAGLSQAELARRVGLAQPTIFQLITRGKKGSTKLHIIARELRTTPAYLTGESDDPSGGEGTEPPLDAETRQLVHQFQFLSTADRKAVLQIARSLAARVLTDPHADQRGGTLHDKDSDFRGE